MNTSPMCPGRGFLVCHPPPPLPSPYPLCELFSRILEGKFRGWTMEGVEVNKKNTYEVLLFFFFIKSPLNIQ